MMLEQLKQRVALRCELTAFTIGETAAYMAARIKSAGGEAAKLFTREAVVHIHEYSRGIPRTINVICDNALLTGCGKGFRGQLVMKRMRCRQNIKETGKIYLAHSLAV